MTGIIVDHTPCEVVVEACDYELVIQTSTVETVVAHEEHELVIEVPGLPGPEGPRGPKGDEGEPGIPGEGPSWWFGSGEPTNIPGSKPGDRYLDEDSGLVYTLGDTESSFAAILKIGA